MTKREMFNFIWSVGVKVAQLGLIVVALWFMFLGEYVKGGSVFVAVIAMALLDISMEASDIKEELKRFNDTVDDVLEEDAYEPEDSIDGLTQKISVCKVKK
ncbi:membrane protein [Bacillus phage YungSlug]|nr:membrane protein [Bacillus phage YungSlug]